MRRVQVTDPMVCAQVEWPHLDYRLVVVFLIFLSIGNTSYVLRTTHISCCIVEQIGFLI